MQSLQLDTINKLLASLRYPDDSLTLLIDTIDADGHSRSHSREYEEKYSKIYKILSENDLFLRIDYATDSYGSDSVTGISFVKAVSTVVTAYEPI